MLKNIETKLFFLDFSLWVVQEAAICRQKGIEKI
jgi:hypothetical protein